jgi:hypothetical protein
MHSTSAFIICLGLRTCRSASLAYANRASWPMTRVSDQSDGITDSGVAAKKYNGTWSMLHIAARSQNETDENQC